MFKNSDLSWNLQWPTFLNPTEPPNPDISRVAPAAAARRRAMTPYSEYGEWPATQRMRLSQLARKVEIFQHHRPEKLFAHWDNPDLAQAAASRSTLSEYRCPSCRC
jgi:hypothetical protein